MQTVVYTGLPQSNAINYQQRHTGSGKMAEKLIKKLNNREFYAKYSDYAAMDEDGERLSDRKVKSVSLDAASGTMTVTSTDGSQEIPVVPVPDQEGKVLKSNADGTYSWGAAGAEPGSGKLYVKFGAPRRWIPISTPTLTAK